MNKLIINIWLGSMIVGLLLFVALGVFYFFAPRETIDAEPSDVSDVLIPPADTMYLDDPEEGTLRLVEYVLDAREIEGSVMNTGDVAYLNVQVHFDLYDSMGEAVGTTADTTGAIDPGDTWLFSIVLPFESPVSRADFARLTAVPQAQTAPPRARE